MILSFSLEYVIEDREELFVDEFSTLIGEDEERLIEVVEDSFVYLLSLLNLSLFLLIV
jgi:hypothetical protein